jgi:hypothetical protein
VCVCEREREREYWRFLDLQKLLKVLRWRLPHGSKLDQNSNSGTRFPKSSLFANTPGRGAGQPNIPARGFG